MNINCVLGVISGPGKTTLTVYLCTCICVLLLLHHPGMVTVLSKGPGAPNIGGGCGRRKNDERFPSSYICFIISRTWWLSLFQSYVLHFIQSWNPLHCTITRSVLLLRFYSQKDMCRTTGSLLEKNLNIFWTKNLITWVPFLYYGLKIANAVIVLCKI